MRFPARRTSSCIWFAIPVELFYIAMPVVRTDGRSIVVRSRNYQIFSHGAPLRALRARAPLSSPTLCDFIMFQYFQIRDLSCSLSWFLCFFFIQNLPLQVDHVTFKERFVCW